jgi:hypothetical protein
MHKTSEAVRTCGIPQTSEVCVWEMCISSPAYGVTWMDAGAVTALTPGL